MGAMLVDHRAARQMTVPGVNSGICRLAELLGVGLGVHSLVAPSLTDRR
jgi:hypothetical protein